MQMSSKATRQAFGEALAKLGETRNDIVVLDADLSKSTKSELFANKFPERFFEMGIAEANMIGTAAGLALSGKVPFCCSFAAFVTGRYDQIRDLRRLLRGQREDRRHPRRCGHRRRRLLAAGPRGHRR